MTWWPAYYLKSLISNNSLDDTLLDISDGGHIENLAVIELLRRRCKLIIGLDNGMDANFEFEDLKNLIKRSKDELGLDIKFRVGYNPFKDIKPGMDTNWSSNKRYGVADIIESKKDADGKKITEIIGTYVYIKSSITKDLGASLGFTKAEIKNLNSPAGEAKEKTDIESIDKTVYNYVKHNADFPHHSTADQFYNSIQFRAYYRLGQSLCRDVFPNLKEPLTRSQIIDQFKPKKIVKRK